MSASTSAEAAASTPWSRSAAVSRGTSSRWSAGTWSWGSGTFSRTRAALRGRGVDAAASAEVDALVADVAGETAPGDVVLVMSNGAFGGFIEKLQAALATR